MRTWFSDLVTEQLNCATLRKKAANRNPKDSIKVTKPRPPIASFHGHKLLAQNQILQQENTTRFIPDGLHVVIAETANKINSISPKNPGFADAVRMGFDVLLSVGHIF